MINNIPKNMLEELSRLITSHTGLYFPEKKLNALKKGLDLVINDLGTDIYQLFHDLQTSPSKEIINAITTRLTIGETYFLRDKNFFQILQDHILRGIIKHPKRKTKKIIFWSAGCATGEEPYSIAILVDQMRPALQGWDITIIGSDINPLALDKAKKGIYSNWSMRGTPEKILKKYFTQTTGNYFEIAPHIRQMVQFCQLNLIDDNYPASLNVYDSMDIVLCRNVLMYFNEQARNNALKKMSNVLIENGWLITGPAESGFVNLDELTSVRFPNALYHRKGPPRKIIENKKPFPFKRDGYYARPIVPTHAARRLTDRNQSRRISDRKISRPPETPKYDMYQEALNDYNRGAYAQSMERLLRIVSQGANNNNSFLMKTESMILLAKSYANIGELEQARNWCEKAIASEKLNPEIYYLLSTIFQSSGDIDESVRSLKQSIYLDPEFIMAHFTLGMLLLQKKMHAESRKSMQNALSLLKLTDADEIPPFSEGMSAGRLIETIKSMKIN
jgi:chemotaxis protein methyltransferase CheR